MTFLLRASGPALVSWPVLVVVLVGSMLVSTLGTGSRSHGDGSTLALVGAAGGLTAYLLVWVAWWSALRWLSGTRRVVLVSCAAATAGMARGLVVQWLFTTLGVGDVDASQLVLRLVMGVMGGLVAFLGTAYGVATVRHYRATTELLSAERQRLTALLDASVESIQQGQASTLARVRQRLDEELRQMTVDSAPAAVAALESLAGDVVRPLSHALARELPEWEHQVAPEVPRVRLADVWRGPVTAVAIQPLLLSGIILVISLPAAILVYQPRNGLSALLVGVLTLLATLSVGKEWMRRRPAATALTGWLRVGVVLVGSTLMASACAALLDRDDPSAGVFPRLAIFAVPMVGFAIAVIAILGMRMRDITADLEDITRQLRWNLSRVNMQQWEQNGLLSRALHGPVQALLHAQLLRLRRQMDAGEVQPVQLDSLRDDLQRALATTLAPTQSPRPVSEVLVDVVDTWQGLARVTWSVTPQAAGVLDQDRLCAHALMDLCSEAVSNSVRHGAATAVDIEIDRMVDGEVDSERDGRAGGDGRNLIRVTVVDNGHLPETDQAGLGTVLLARCTYDWSLQGEPTKLIALLPCAVGVVPDTVAQPMTETPHVGARVSTRGEYAASTTVT